MSKLIYDGADFFVLDIAPTDLPKLPNVIFYSAIVGNLFRAYDDGNFQAIKNLFDDEEMFKKYPDLINEINENNMTLLACACKDGNEDLVKYLVKALNVDLNKGIVSKIHNTSPLEIAIQNHHIGIGEILTANGCKIEKAANGVIELHTSGLTETLFNEGFEEFLKKANDIFDSYGKIAESFTSEVDQTSDSFETNNDEVFAQDTLENDQQEDIISNDTKVEVYNMLTSSFNDSSLSQKEIIEIINSNRGIETMSNQFHQSLMHHAAKHGLNEVVENLAKLTPSLVNAPDTKGFYPLDYALTAHNVKTVEKLIEYGANFSKFASLYLSTDESWQKTVYEHYVKILYSASESSYKLTSKPLSLREKILSEACIDLGPENISNTFEVESAGNDNNFH